MKSAVGRLAIVVPIGGILVALLIIGGVRLSGRLLRQADLPELAFSGDVEDDLTKAHLELAGTDFVVDVRVLSVNDAQIFGSGERVEVVIESVDWQAEHVSAGAGGPALRLGDRLALDVDGDWRLEAGERVLLGYRSVVSSGDRDGRVTMAFSPDGPQVRRSSLPVSRVIVAAAAVRAGTELDLAIVLMADAATWAREGLADPPGLLGEIFIAE